MEKKDFDVRVFYKLQKVIDLVNEKLKLVLSTAVSVSATTEELDKNLDYIISRLEGRENNGK